MLDFWIIEKVLERERLSSSDHPRVELPLHAPELEEDDKAAREEMPERGVVIIDLGE